MDERDWMKIAYDTLMKDYVSYALQYPEHFAEKVRRLAYALAREERVLNESLKTQ